MSASPAKTGDKPKRAPTLYFIVTIKLVKGSLLLLTALGIFALHGQNLGDVFDQFLRWIHLDPEHRFFLRIGEALDQVTSANRRLAELGTFLFGLILVGGGLGLAFRARWAVWLAIGESAFFIPIEIYELLRLQVGEAPSRPHAELFRHPELGLFLVLALNVLIVWYLFANRRRIFRHHHD
jgi:uncharacterized membrane protein (DUF2068 family)